MEEVTETIIVVTLDEAEVELIGMFLGQWEELVNLDGEDESIIERFKELVNRLMSKLDIKKDDKLGSVNNE